MPASAPTPDHLLISFVEHLPLQARRLIVLGEPMEKTLDSYVTTLVECGWTSQHIWSFFFSGLPFESIKAFQRKYRNHRQSMLQRIIQRACPKRRQSLPEELATHPGLETHKPALHRLATFAQGLYDGTQTGCFLAALPIGSGKTTQFLIPFVTHCMKQDISRGIIVAMERREDVKTYAAAVNTQFDDPVAYALFSHDPDPSICPENCRKDHKEWKTKADNYPLLFLTHEMLSRRGVDQYQQRAGVNRIMAIIDEKPSSWWGKGDIVKQDLELLQAYLCHVKGDTKVALLGAMQEALNKLQTAKHGDKIQLQAKLAPEQVQALSQWLQAAKSVSEENKSCLQHTLDNLFALGQSPGVLAKETDEEDEEDYGDGHILISHRRQLPSLPTILLDGTGVYDPEYPDDITHLDINPWEGMTPPRKHIHLVTWDKNLTKGRTLDPGNWKHIWNGMDELGVITPRKLMYILSAKQNEAAIQDKLETSDEWERLSHWAYGHYGNTKGKNDYRKAAAIVFTSVQFKGDPYYQAIALNTGKGVIPARATRWGKKNRSYIDPRLQSIKIRDTAVTLAQEIGRTRIRGSDAADVAVLLPWCDVQGVAVLIHQLIDQFQATVTHEQRQVSSAVSRTQRERLLSLLQPGARLERQDITEQVGIMGDNVAHTRKKLRQLLGDKETKKELWAREIEWMEKDPISVPEETRTQARLNTAKEHPPSEQVSSQANAA